jgi:hypothetical protein
MANKPALVFPFHDPTGHLYDLLTLALPTLKDHFSQAFISITPPTIESLGERIEKLTKNSFLTINYNAKSSNLADHHLSAYRNAANLTAGDQILHLVQEDRLLYALANHETAFYADIEKAKAPHLFIRSPKAWDTHPDRYRRLEYLTTSLGELVFEKKLEFSWCHLAVTSSLLRQSLPKETGPGFTFMAQIIIPLIPELTVSEVDWLSWEDPYILDRDQAELKAERNQDLFDFRRRLEYALPALNLIHSAFLASIPKVQ